MSYKGQTEHQDQNPQEASECDLDKGGRSTVYSCGHCGMLSGASYPFDVEIDSEKPDEMNQLGAKQVWMN